MKVAVIGSRSITDSEKVRAALDRLLDRLKHFVLISGGARGVDTIAEQWAREKGLPVLIFRPDYQKHDGKKAPLIRNRDLISRADTVVAFWDGHSTGTAHAMGIARELGKRVVML